MQRITGGVAAYTALTADAAGMAILVVAAITGWLSTVEALILALGGVCLTALAVLVVWVRRLDTRTRRQDARTAAIDGQVQRVLTDTTAIKSGLSGSAGLTARAGQAEKDVATLRRDLGAQSRRLDGLEQVLSGTRTMVARTQDLVTRTQDLVSGIGDTVRAGFESAHTAQAALEASVSENFERASAERSRLHARLYADIEAHGNLSALVVPRAPMPALGGWALNADVLHILAQLLWDERAELIVECGSGSSSVWLGYVAERLGRGRVVALEHDERFLQASRDLVRAHDLEKLVEVRFAPLTPWSASGPEQDSFNWYDRAAVEDLHDIDLLLVDGPPELTGPQARYPAGPLLIPRCSPRGVVVLDDTGRSGERALSDRWLREFPFLERTEVARGLAHVFRRQRPVGSTTTPRTRTANHDAAAAYR